MADEFRVRAWLAQRGLGFDWTAPIEAAKEGRLDILQWLERNGIFPDIYAANWAAVRGHQAVVNWLAQRGIYPDQNWVMAARLA